MGLSPWAHATTNCCAIVMLAGVAKWERPPAPMLSAVVLESVLTDTCSPWLGESAMELVCSISTMYLAVSPFFYIFRQILLSPFYTRRNWDSERLRDFPSVTQLIGGRGRIGAQTWLPPKFVCDLYAQVLPSVVRSGSRMEGEILDDKCVWFYWRSMYKPMLDHFSNTHLAQIW